jgi:hypothetical protein
MVFFLIIIDNINFTICYKFDESILNHNNNLTYLLTNMVNLLLDTNLY